MLIAVLTVPPTGSLNSWSLKEKTQLRKLPKLAGTSFENEGPTNVSGKLQDMEKQGTPTVEKQGTPTVEEAGDPDSGLKNSNPGEQGDMKPFSHRSGS